MSHNCIENWKVFVNTVPDDSRVEYSCSDYSNINREKVKYWEINLIGTMIHDKVENSVLESLKTFEISIRYE